MNEKTIKFTIFERTITTTMQGDREESVGWDAGDELAGELTSLDEAIERAQKWALEDDVETHSTRYGIGIMSRPVYEIFAWTKDENDDFFTCDMNGEPSLLSVYILDVLDLHPEYKEAWNMAKKDYLLFLDYSGDGYGYFIDYLPNSL